MSAITRTDVTAVKLFNSLILAGIGSYINIFNKKDSKLLQRLKGLIGQKIYGFVPLETSKRILVFGGKQFSVITPAILEDSKELYTLLFDPVVCDDWIHSGIWLEDNTIATLSAHNVVQKWDILTQSLLTEFKSKDNSILYSGLLVALRDGLLVFAGTVFSEVIVHISGDLQPIHCLKGHRGVIFSISCKPERNIITTTSDDRSVRIWTIISSNKTNFYSKEYWKHAQIHCAHEIYGHVARVMKSSITNTFVISVGEDSNICFWNHEGNLLRKVASHQNGSVWSVDADAESVVTGGGDCGVTIHPLSMALEYGDHEVINLNEIPKKVLFTARRNILVLTDNNEVVYYDCSLKSSSVVCKLKHESTYKLISLSSCKQIIAISDMKGCLNVFTENCKGEPYIKMIVDDKVDIGKVLSMQWAGNRHLVFCSDNGIVSVIAANGCKIEKISTFTLPRCKERWLTATAIDPLTNSVVVGDRCGNIHVYVQGEKEPQKSFSKIHGRYGPTTITIVNNNIISTGRDGTIKTFLVTQEGGLLKSVKYLNANKFEFAWVEKFLDRNNNIVCGFQERIFVVYNIKDNNKLIEIPCGGGHRSWDAMRYFDRRKHNLEEFIDFIYIQNSIIYSITFQMSMIIPQKIVEGTHSKEINCLKLVKCSNNESNNIFISGGEDTTLRISKIDSALHICDHVISKHLSSIRALKVQLFKDSALIISAGGRAQLCIDKINYGDHNNDFLVSIEQLVDHLIKGKDKERKNNQNWRNCSIDFDPETRIMDIEIVESTKDNFLVFAGCSDALLRAYKFVNKENLTFIPVAEIKHHKTCILKTHCINFNARNLLVTCTTRGVVAIWNICDITSINNDMLPFFVTEFNKSGINSLASQVLSDESVLIASGGDDNTIHIKLFKIKITHDRTTVVDIKEVDSWNSDRYHCSQITGLVYVDDMLISASIDQRITVLKWNVAQDLIACEFMSQNYSDVADIQGLELIENCSDTIKVCVFGKGMEIIEISKRVS